MDAIISSPVIQLRDNAVDCSRYLGSGLVLIRTFIPNFEKFTKQEAALEVCLLGCVYRICLHEPCSHWQPRHVT